jgi:hypothetical protein
MDKKISALPISFEQFSKDPVKGFLFITLIAIGYLYVDQKMQYTEQIERQGNKIEKLEAKIDALGVQLKRSDSLLSATTSKILVLQELGKIK